MNRVVVTGIGIVTPLGFKIDVVWEKLLYGQSPVKKIAKFIPNSNYPQICAEIQDFDSSAWLAPKEARRIDPFIAYSVAASKMALQDAAIDHIVHQDRAGVWIGSGFGGIHTLVNQIHRSYHSETSKISPFTIPYMIHNMASGKVAIDLGLKGMSNCSVTACASGANSIGEAMRCIQMGEMDMMLAGGIDASVHPTVLAGFSAAGALSNNTDSPDLISKPFDRDRDGFVLSEGGAVFVLENLESALKHQRRIYAECVSYVSNSDAYHITSPAPNGEGAYRAMKTCLDRGKVPADKVTYLNAHGTSTRLNDKHESIAIFDLFSDKIAVSSTKSITGHMQAGSSAFEAAVTVLSIHKNQIHLNKNFTHRDPELAPIDIVKSSRDTCVEYAMTNSFGFGGHNACLLFKKFTG